MINFLRNHFYRIASKKSFCIISIIMTVISITLAVYFNSKVQANINVAVVTNNKAINFHSDYIKISILKKKPEKYKLVMGKYDGVLIDKGNGKYGVETIKDNGDKKMLQSIAENPRGFVPERKDARGIGTNIIGYLMMSLLLQCSIFMFTLSEDMELKQIQRIVNAPISFGEYLLSHFLCAFSVIFTPAFLALVVMKSFLGFDIGFSLVQYAVLLWIMCSLGISFALLINSLAKVADTANMLCSSILLLTTILSGSFYSFEKGNELFAKAIWVLPQKAFLSFVSGLEEKKEISSMLPQLSYVAIIAVLFFAFSIATIKKDYVLRKD